jgi:hypothetical protein
MVRYDGVVYQNNKELVKHLMSKGGTIQVVSFISYSDKKTDLAYVCKGRKIEYRLFIDNDSFIKFIKSDLSSFLTTEQKESIKLYNEVKRDRTNLLKELQFNRKIEIKRAIKQKKQSDHKYSKMMYSFCYDTLFVLE